MPQTAEVMYAMFGYDWQVVGYYCAESSRFPCSVCGNGIAHRFSITKEGHGIKTVGPECVKHVTAPSGVRFAEAVARVAEVYEAEWELPSKAAQLKAGFDSWKDSAHYPNGMCSIPNKVVTVISYRIHRAIADNANPDGILRVMRKHAPEWSFAWLAWTQDELAERDAYVTPRVQEYIAKHNPTSI